MSTHYSPQFLQDLEADVARAVSVVQKLTSDKAEMAEMVPKGTEAMPRSELHFAAGLAFHFVKKGGVGLSFEHGHGFVIAKLPSDKAGRLVEAEAPALTATSVSASGPLPWVWSAPMFIKVNAGGFGVTLGYTEIDSVTILDTPEAVRSFTHTVVELDSDITGAAGSVAAAHLPATAANLSDLRLSDKEFTYSIAKGIMVDVSLTGLAYSVDTERNNEAYGEFASPTAILEGGVVPPAAVHELYAALDHVLQGFYAEQGEGQRRVQAEVAGGGAAGGAAAGGEHVHAE